MQWSGPMLMVEMPLSILNDAGEGPFNRAARVARILLISGAEVGARSPVANSK